MALFLLGTLTGVLASVLAAGWLIGGLLLKALPPES